MPPRWIDALDLEQARKNCESDIFGDWYRDPWQWPDLMWVAIDAPEIVIRRAGETGVRQAIKTDVAKEGFGTRPAVILDPVDRLLYQALVDSLSIDLIGDLADWVYGWRLPHEGASGPGRYSRSSKQWDGFRARLADLANTFEACLTTDIVSYFASVDLKVLERRIRTRRSNGVADRLIDMVSDWDKIVGRSGLAQRSSASAVLANLFLGPLDDVINHYGSEAASGELWGLDNSAARWMDDIWLASDDTARLRRAQRDLEQGMRDLGLHMNMGKTDILEGDNFLAAVQKREHSAVDKGLNNFPSDETALDERIDEMIADPEHTPRTNIRFITTRMRIFGAYSRVSEVAEVAARMPHGADHLARLFRDSGHWRELQGWFIEYRASDLACIEWSVAQFATMFPADATVETAVKDSHVDLVSPGHSLNQLSVGAQRLAAWDRDLARVVIREAAARSSHHLERRVLALSALGAGEERDTVERWLNEFRANDSTREYLKARTYAPPRLNDDFTGVAAT